MCSSARLFLSFCVLYLALSPSVLLMLPGGGFDSRRRGFVKHYAAEFSLGNLQLDRRGLKKVLDPSMSQLFQMEGCAWALPARQSPSPSRKLAHLAVIAQLALQSQPAFTQRALASFPSLPPSLARFLSLSRKGDPLYSSEIKTGRCKLQINVIKCLCYHKPSHWTGWLAGWLGLPPPPSTPTRISCPSLCLPAEERKQSDGEGEGDGEDVFSTKFSHLWLSDLSTAPAAERLS